MEKVYDDDINKRFDHHAPDEFKIQKHQIVRSSVKATAQDLFELLPEGREKALALTKLEEALMWANAAIARD
jgi:nanoRNase/pAp phosphatase (c-di-AMP/oligoRNAs hydrolase)